MASCATSIRKASKLFTRTVLVLAVGFANLAMAANEPWASKTDPTDVPKSHVQEVTTAIAQLDVITQKNAALADQSRHLLDLGRGEQLANALGARYESVWGYGAPGCTVRTGRSHRPVPRSSPSRRSAGSGRAARRSPPTARPRRR